MANLGLRRAPHAAMQLAAAIAFLGGLLFNLAGPASADGEGAGHAARVHKVATGSPERATPRELGDPLSPDHLGRVAGGAGVAAPAVPVGQDTAVILWDELKRPRPPSQPGNGGRSGGSVRMSVSNH